MTTLWNESFETNGLGTRYGLSDPEFHTATSTINDDFFGRTDGTILAGVAFSSSVAYAGKAGTFFFAANDTDEVATSVHSRQITFDTIDISGFDTLEFSGLFAEDDFTNGTEDWDADTLVYVEASIDGGSYFKILQFAATGPNTAPLLDTNFDGVGDSVALTDTFKAYTPAIAGTGSDLDLRIVLENLNSNDEDIAFDDLTVTGNYTAGPATATVDVVSFDDSAAEGDVTAQVTVFLDHYPNKPSFLRVTPSSADLDLGSGPGVAHFVPFSTGPVSITIVATDDALVEGDETHSIGIELQSSAQLGYTINPIADVDIRVLDNDVDNTPESAFELFTEGFETDGNGTRYTTSAFEYSDGSEDFFIRTDGSNISADYEVSGAEGSFFFAGQDIDSAIVIGSQSAAQTLNFTGIDISGFENLVLSALVAEDDDGTLQDIDATDGLRIRARIDGGSFVDVLGFEAGGDFSNAMPQLDTDLDGNGDGAIVTDTFTQFTAAIAGMGSTLDLEIEFEASFSDEDFAIDDIRLTGDAVADFSVTPLGFVDLFEGGATEDITVHLTGAPDAGDTIETVVTWDPTEYSVNGDTTGSLTLTSLGSDFLATPDGQIEQVLTLQAIDDSDDEGLDEGIGQALTFDIVSADYADLDAFGPVTVSSVRIWDNDGDTGADPDGRFLLHQEGFEVDGAGTRYVLDRPEFNSQTSIFGGDWFTRTTGGSDLQNTTPLAETYGITGGSEGSWFFSTQDYGGVDSSDVLASLTISGIEIEGFVNLHLDLDLAEDDQDDGFEDWDPATSLMVEANIDGAGWTQILGFEATNSVDTEPGHDTDLDGSRDGQALSEVWTEFGADIAGTGDVLDVRLTFNSFRFSGEDISVDDIRVTGDVDLPGSFDSTGDFFGFGDFISDTVTAPFDGIDDFVGRSSSSSVDFTVLGANAASEFLLGQTARFIVQGATGVSEDYEGVVTHTNVEDGYVVIEGAEITTAGFDAFVLGASSFGDVASLQLEIGDSTAPTLISVAPLDDSTGVALNSSLLLTFDAPVAAGAGVIEVRRSSDDGLVDAFTLPSGEVAFAGTNVVITPLVPLPPGEDIYVAIGPGVIRDTDGNPFAGISDPTAFNFVTNAAPETTDSMILTTPGTSETHFVSATDPDGNALTFALDTPVVDGSISLGVNGTFTYTAPAGPDVDVFTYDVDDANGNVVGASVSVLVVDETTLRDLDGTDGNDVLRGGTLDDDIRGGLGVDLIFGAEGADTLNGGFGADDLKGGADGDLLIGDFGDDMLFGENGGDTLIGGGGDDLLDGGAGIDTASYADAGGRVAVFLARVPVDLGGGQGTDTFVSIENVIGTNFDDRLVGDANDNVLDGGIGDDVLIGNAGDDYLIGGNGADVLTGSGGDDTLDGGNGADFLYGLGGADSFGGGGGNDWIEGGLGVDLINGDGGADDIFGFFGADTIEGGIGDDNIRADGSGDIVNGGAGNDRLVGGNGQDTLWGGSGNDIYFGGSGTGGGDGIRDTYVFKSAANGGGGFDIIRDFEDTTDKIDLSESGYTNFADVFADAAQVGANVEINFDFSGLLVIDNFLLSDLTAGDFLF